MGGHWCPTAQPPPASSALLVGLRDDNESGTVCAWRPPSRVTQEAVTGAHTQPDRSPSSTRAPKSFGRRDVNRCAKVLGVSVDFEATDWLALAHGPIVDIMITYGVLGSWFGCWTAAPYVISSNLDSTSTLSPRVPVGCAMAVASRPAT